MPYKNPERKRQWEREHREQRNAKRKMQREPARSGQSDIPTPAPDPVAARKMQANRKLVLEIIRVRKLRSRSGHVSAPKPSPDPASDQKPKSAWKVVAGIAVFVLAVGTGVLAALGGVSGSLDSGPGRPSV